MFLSPLAFVPNALAFFAIANLADLSNSSLIFKLNSVTLET